MVIIIGVSQKNCHYIVARDATMQCSYWIFDDNFISHLKCNYLITIFCYFSESIVLVQKPDNISFTVLHQLNILTPWNRVLLEKLAGSQAVKKLPAFYGTRRFITSFTSAHHLSFFWARSIQSMPPHLTFWRSILILSSHLRLGLQSCVSPSDFPAKTLYTPLL